MSSFLILYLRHCLCLLYSIRPPAYDISLFFPLPLTSLSCVYTALSIHTFYIAFPRDLVQSVDDHVVRSFTFFLRLNKKRYRPHF